MPTYYGESAFLNLPARPVQGGDPHFNNVVLQLPLRAHLRDESKTAKTVTVNGDTKIVGGAAYFDGTGDCLSLADSDDFYFGAGAFTVEAWVRFGAMPSASAGFVFASQWDDNGVNERAWLFQLYNNAGTYQLGWLDSADGTSIATIRRDTWAGVTTGVWYHVAAVKYQSTLLLFVNGVPLSSATSHTATLKNSASLVRVGAAVSGGVVTVYHNGYIKDLRITKGVARYVANFVPPASLPTHGVAALNRRVPIALSEARRAPLLRRRNKLSEGIASLWALPGDVVLIHSGRKLAAMGDVVSRQTYCVNTQVNATTFAAVQVVQGALNRVTYTSMPAVTGGIFKTATIIAEVDCSVVSSPTYHRFVTLGNEGLCIRGYQDGKIQVLGFISGTLQLFNVNSQYTTGRHIYAVSYDGSYFRVYKDGALVGTSSLYSGVLSNTYGFSQVNHPTEYVNGKILRAVGFNRALSLSEINYWAYGVDYERFFTLPSRAVSASYMKSESARAPVLARRAQSGGDPHFNNVVLQLPLRRSATAMEQHYARSLTVGAGVAYSPARVMNFNGSTAWIYTDTSADFNPSKTWTFEGWYYATNRTSSPYLFSAYSAPGTRWAVQLPAASSTTLSYYGITSGTQEFIDSTISPSQTGWNHLALCHDANTGKLSIFYNGSRVYCGTPTYGLPDVSMRLEIGAAAFNSSNSLSGYFADVRYTRGVARYDNDFSVLRAFDLTWLHPIFGNSQEFRLPLHGVPSRSVPALAAPAYSAASSAVISGAADALSADDIADIVAILRTSGALDATCAVDVSAIAGVVASAASRIGTIDALGGVDVSAFVGGIVARGDLSPTLVGDLAAAVGKIITRGTLAATLSDDELAALGRAWPTMYKVATGITLSSPSSALALSDVVTTIGSFPPVVISNVTMP